MRNPASWWNVLTSRSIERLRRWGIWGPSAVPYLYLLAGLVKVAGAPDESWERAEEPLRRWFFAVPFHGALATWSFV